MGVPRGGAVWSRKDVYAAIKAGLIIGAVVIVTVLATKRESQAQSPLPSAGVEAELVGDDIVVTARRREELLRNVPFGIRAIGADELESARVLENRALARRTANLQFLDSGVRGFNRLIIRGIGDVGGGFAPDDNSVGFFIDGVPVPLVAIDSDFLDIERIEILRGPQNVLFGRNAQGGAISVTTADPSETPEFSISAEYGNLQQRRVRATASGPITDAVGGRLALEYRGRQGDVPNDLGGDVRGIDVFNALGKVTADLGEDTEAKLFLRYEHQDEDVLLRLFTEDPAFPRVRLDIVPEQEVENLTTGLTIEHDFGGVVLTSLTGFHYSDYFFRNDQSDGRLFSATTGFPPALFDDPTADFATQVQDEVRLNQEFRLTGEAFGADWLFGGNIFYSDLDSEFFLDITGLFAGTFNASIQTQSYGVFGSVDVPVTEDIRISAEGRFTHEVEDFRGGFIGVPGGALVALNQQDLSESFSFFTGRLSASYAVTDQITSYATVARGAKAGGFSILDTDLASVPGAAPDEFDTATTLSFEAGIRGSVLNDRLFFSLTGFYNDTKDEQLAAFDFATFTASIENADTRTYGGELEITARPIEDLQIQGALGLLQTEITSAPVATGALVGGEVPNAANITLSLGADYTLPLAPFGLNADLTFGAEYQYVGERAADIGNTRTLESFDVVNLRLRLDGDGYEIYAFADNLLDEVYATGAFPFGTTPGGAPVSTGGVGQPRLFGVGAKLEF